MKKGSKKDDIQEIIIADKILRKIEREYERQIPAFKRLPVAMRAKFVRQALCDAVAEVHAIRQAKGARKLN